MEKIIFNGDLYIKRYPSKVKYQLQVPYFNICDINNNEALVITNAKDLEKLPPFVVEILEQNGIVKKSEDVVYDNAGFYQIFINGSKIYMINKNTKQVLVFNSIEEVEREFISLYEFIKKAIYVGRLFGNNGVNQELLYNYENIYLVKMPFIDEYTIIDKKDPMLKHDTIGEILPVYYEKNALYKAIIEQAVKLNADNNEQKR